MSHQDRRDPLPKGYQYGDAGKCGVGDVLSRRVATDDGWQDYGLFCARRLATVIADHWNDDWNVIEGEH